MTGVTSLTQNGTCRSERANVSLLTADDRVYSCCCSCYAYFTNNYKTNEKRINVKLLLFNYTKDNNNSQSWLQKSTSLVKQAAMLRWFST